jgi:hypothetical protein
VIFLLVFCSRFSSLDNNELVGHSGGGSVRELT